MRFVSYAQEFEDLILFVGLKEYVKNGFYIDVGANDPESLSVTKAFYDRGWNGINIEPLDDKFKLLCNERMRDINLNMGVGEVEGELELYCAATGSTFSTKTAQDGKFSNNPKILKKIYTLTKVYMEYCLNNQDVHFLKIDVEGYEREVLRGIDFSVFRPWVIVVEAAKPGTTIPCYEEWEDILLENKYILATANGINRYYIDVYKSFLKNEFSHSNLTAFIQTNDCYVSVLNNVVIK